MVVYVILLLGVVLALGHKHLNEYPNDAVHKLVVFLPFVDPHLEKHLTSFYEPHKQLDSQAVAVAVVVYTPQPLDISLWDIYNAS